MKVEIGENNCLLVFLEQTEVAKFELDSAVATADSERLGQIMNRIFAGACRLAHFNAPRESSRHLEILPFRNGTMLICFSFENKRMKITARCKNAGTAPVFEFDSHEHLRRCLASSAFKKNAVYRLFQNEDSFRLVSEQLPAAAKNLLSEFSLRVADPLAAAQTREFWEEVPLTAKTSESSQ